MNDETLLTWNVTNWITVLLMVATVWWLVVGASRLIMGRQSKEGPADA